MKSSENLLVSAMEESNELSMAISKALRFGVEGQHCEAGEGNNYSIVKEYIQLRTVMNMLFDQGILKPVSSLVSIAIELDKKAKIKKYQQVSKELGCIED